MELILASASPRRRELLEAAGLHFRIRPAGIEESVDPGETPQRLVERLAREKAEHVAAREPNAFVLGADTVVAVDDRILGKPADTADALGLLRQLAGRSHCVWTGVALCAPDGARFGASVSTRVSFRALDDRELRRYAESGEGLDKAGAYALQGEGRRLVAGIEGSESNVIGLPVAETLALLARAGFPAPDEKHESWT